MKNLISILFLLATTYGFAQQLVYTPKNPAFGGDPFNYTWLLNSADSQNSFSENSLDVLGDFNSFSDGLNQQFLNTQYGQELPEEGTSRDGNLEYEVYESTEGLVINILDITTGEQSQIIIPN
jgi:curli production assembly/transport component CsgF